MSVEVAIRRTIPLPRQQVFAAGARPPQPHALDVPRRRHEGHGRERRTGRRQVPDRDGARRRRDRHWGEYLAIDPPSLLSFTWTSAHTDLQPTVVVIELFDRNGDTELVLTHRRLPERTADAHRNGWTQIVQKLDETLSGR